MKNVMVQVKTLEKGVIILAKGLSFHFSRQIVTSEKTVVVQVKTLEKGVIVLAKGLSFYFPRQMAELLHGLHKLRMAKLIFKRVNPRLCGHLEMVAFLQYLIWILRLR